LLPFTITAVRFRHGSGSIDRVAGLLLLFAAIEGALLFKSTIPITAYVVASLVITASQGRFSDTLRWYRQLRPLMVLQSAGVLAAVVAVAVGLLALNNPVLDWGWWTVVAAQVGDQNGGGNIITAPFSYPLLIPPFVILLVLVLPRLAETEELMFRRGTRSWRDGAGRSLLFGLIHMLVGVPLAVALALSIGGLWFTRQYFLGGTHRSTLYHLMYNCLALALVLVAVAWP
jgi:hypothetical protein